MRFCKTFKLRLCEHIYALNSLYISYPLLFVHILFRALIMIFHINPPHKKKCNEIYWHSNYFYFISDGEIIPVMVLMLYSHCLLSRLKTEWWLRSLPVCVLNDYPKYCKITNIYRSAWSTWKELKLGWVNHIISYSWSFDSEMIQNKIIRSWL